MIFSIKHLLWLMACVALGCWLLTLPQILQLQLYNPQSGETILKPYRMLWPAEVAARVAVCVAIFWFGARRLRSR